MSKFTLLILVCTISTGFLQEITSLFQPPTISNDNVESQIWSLQNLPEGRRRVKPCPKRRNNKNDPEEQWIPSYTSRITHPLHKNAVLQPQALTNEEFTPRVEPNTILEQLNYPDQRLFSSSNTNLVDRTEDDCGDELDLANGALTKTGDAEKLALSIIQDCLRKKQNNKLVESSRRSMSDPNASDLSSNDNNNNYPRYVTSENSTNHNVNNNNYAPDSSEDSSRSIGSRDTIEDRNANQLTTKLIDPEIGNGIANGRATENYLKNARICYACSSATNPSCWEPNNRTTVKYCTREKSCVTKSFGMKNSLTMIRDCANSCDDSPVPGLEPKFKSCKLCHSDYCNSAISINSYNLVIILIISIVKCTF